MALGYGLMRTVPGIHKLLVWSTNMQQPSTRALKHTVSALHGAAGQPYMLCFRQADIAKQHEYFTQQSVLERRSLCLLAWLHPRSIGRACAPPLVCLASLRTLLVRAANRVPGPQTLGRVTLLASPTSRSSRDAAGLRG